MDSLTQIVLGAAVGEAVLGKKAGNYAMLWGAIAGTIPDLDIFASRFTDNVTALEIHRGFSHSIVFCLIAAPILGYIASKIHKKKNATLMQWCLLFFLCLVTHPMLDAHTTWGTQLFWPLDIRLAFKNIFVIDPLYTLPFLLCCIMAMRLKKGNPKRQKWNKRGLIISSCYMLITLMFKWYAYNSFEKALKANNIAYQEIETRPTPFNAILWSANIKVEDGYRIAYYSLLDEKAIDFSVFIPQNKHLIESIKEEKKVKQLIQISEGWYAIEKDKNKIYFNDLRFGQNSLDQYNAQFVFSYEIGYDKHDRFYAKERPKDMQQGKRTAKEFLQRMLGN
jgi:inner membrane protein